MKHLNTSIVGVSLALVAGGSIAVDDATVQQIQFDANEAQSKANQNAAEIQNLKGGLPAEQAARETGDAVLQDQIGLLDQRVTALEGGGPRYLDNGDGTITDTETGLMWEMKLAPDGTDGGNCDNTIQENRDIRCANNIFTYSASGPYSILQTGTLFTSFLDILNLERADSYAEECFAGYCDWRIPKMSELRSLLLESGNLHYSCQYNPCIDPIFEPTMGERYWTSTYLSYPPYTSISYVDFDSGLSWPTTYTTNAFYARAVRNTR